MTKEELDELRDEASYDDPVVTQEQLKELLGAWDERDKLREALKGVTFTSRSCLCWCDNSPNTVVCGPKCVSAKEALRLKLGAPER